jgi:hypothetical protein
MHSARNVNGVHVLEAVPHSSKRPKTAEAVRAAIPTVELETMEGPWIQPPVVSSAMLRDMKGPDEEEDRG